MNDEEFTIRKSKYPYANAEEEAFAKACIAAVREQERARRAKTFAMNKGNIHTRKKKKEV